MNSKTTSMICSAGTFIDTAVNYQDGESEAWFSHEVDVLEANGPCSSLRLSVGVKSSTYMTISMHLRSNSSKNNSNILKVSYHSIRRLSRYWNRGYKRFVGVLATALHRSYTAYSRNFYHIACSMQEGELCRKQLWSTGSWVKN